MNACDIVAYAYDGAVYCSDCEPKGKGVDRDQVSPWFADSMDELEGSTCDTCAAFFAEGEWRTKEEVREFRWSTCGECNSQKPHDRGDARVRLQALQGQLRCSDCGRPAVHF